MKNRLMLFAADVIALTLSACFGLFWFPIARNDFIFTLVVLARVKIFLFAQAGLYRAILRFAGLSLASSILRATTAASIVVFALVRLFLSEQPAVGFFIMDYLFSSFFFPLFPFI